MSASPFGEIIGGRETFVVGVAAAQPPEPGPVGVRPGDGASGHTLPRWVSLNPVSYFRP